MKILIITETIHAGGAETFVLRLARKLNSLGVSTDILSMNPDLEDEALINQFPDLKIHRVSPPLLRWVKRADRLLKMTSIDISLQYWLTRRAIEKRGLLHYDVYHTHLLPVDLLFATLKQQHMDMRVVSTLHGDYNDYENVWNMGSPHKILNWPRKVALIKNAMDRWIYISKNQVALFHDAYKLEVADMRKIYNGYEPPVVMDAPHGHAYSAGLNFIMVGRGIKEKGWDYLVKAFMKLQGPHTLTLVGKGPALDALKPICKDDKRIIFTGFHPNPAELIQEADVFAFPSVYIAESLPTVIIEALYCGKPVIATKVGEIAEMIGIAGSEEKAGLLLEVNPDTLADDILGAMNRYIADRELLLRHQGLARKAFVKFDMEECARKYIHVYEEVCNDN